ncbi:MAG: dethiobiotin synthase [Myxococcales bacterium]
MTTRGILLVGTDTAVGKTSVGVGLLRLAHRTDFRLIPYKPVETGCDPSAEDATRLCAAAAIADLAPKDVCPLRFIPPVAPSLAARLAGRPIEPQTLRGQAALLLRRGDALLVESAGGLLTPYAPGLTSASLADLFDIDVLLISANRLGTINHTALALAELDRRRARLAGLVLVTVNGVASPDQPHNAQEIAALTGVTALGTLRYSTTMDPDSLADALLADVDLAGLFGGALLARNSPSPP